MQKYIQPSLCNQGIATKVSPRYQKSDTSLLPQLHKVETPTSSLFFCLSLIDYELQQQFESMQSWEATEMGQSCILVDEIGFDIGMFSRLIWFTVSVPAIQKNPK